MVGRRDVSFEEWRALLHLFRAEDVALKENEQRLLHLGLIDQGDGIALSAAGRTLIEHELLLERRNRLQH
ncbi:hypothetical protein EDE05_11764 [Neorhizobium sp. R1-B]|jgi:hypothetical protein|nr:hypothetical protein EDE05_11764 [Neorhizobium sp. R1-B]